MCERGRVGVPSATDARHPKTDFVLTLVYFQICLGAVVSPLLQKLMTLVYLGATEWYSCRMHCSSCDLNVFECGIKVCWLEVLSAISLVNISHDVVDLLIQLFAVVLHLEMSAALLVYVYHGGVQ